MHGSELELGLGAHTLGEGSVVDHVAKSLTIYQNKSISSCSARPSAGRLKLPFRLELLENLPLGVVADNTGVDEPAEVEDLGPELRHIGW